MKVCEAEESMDVFGRFMLVTATLGSEARSAFLIYCVCWEVVVCYLVMTYSVIPRRRFFALFDACFNEEPEATIWAAAAKD